MAKVSSSISVTVAGSSLILASTRKERRERWRYLESIGLNPGQVVNLIVATHWHDDHIRGLARLVSECKEATFSCAAALCREDFFQ